MTITVPVQTRLDHDLAKAIDAHASNAKTTRADVLRELVAIGWAALQGAPAPAIDPLLDRILDALARLDVKVDECRDASLGASVNAFAAYATTRLHALKMLPQDQQQAFVGQLVPVVAKVVQP